MDDLNDYNSVPRRPGKEAAPDELTAIRSRLRAWIRDFGHDSQPAFVDDLRAVLDGIAALQREHDRVVQLNNELMDESRRA